MSRGLIAALVSVVAWAPPVPGQTASPYLPPESPALPAQATQSTPGEAGCLADPGAFPGAPGLFSFDADYVLWSFPKSRQPVGIGRTGSAGSPTLLETLGDEHLNRQLHSGGRFALGYWLTDPNPYVPGGEVPRLGAEARFFFVPQRSVDFRDDLYTTLVRPFFDLNNRQESSVVVAAPGLATGSLNATASRSMWGAEANAWGNVYYDHLGTTCSVDVMAGLRYLDLDENARIGRVSSFVANPQGFPDFAPLAGNRIVEQESFATRNRFYGGQVGVRSRLYVDEGVVVTSQFQLALGNTNEEITIQGSQVRTTPAGQTIVSPGALLALPSNIGRFHRDKFTQVPEFNVNMAFPITGHLTLAVGFTALYWSRVAPVGAQVDRVIDITQIPSFPGAATATPTGLSRPQVPFNEAGLWLLGTFLSAEVKW
jgi:hypothetical protein